MRLIKVSTEKAILCGGFSKVMVCEPETLDELQITHPKLCIQLIDANYVGGDLHLELIGQQVCEIQKRGNTRKIKLDLEIIIRIACDTRIASSISSVGLKSGVMDIAVLAIGSPSDLRSLQKELDMKWKSDDSVLRVTPSKLKFLTNFHQLSSNSIESALEKDNALPFLLAEKSIIVSSKSRNLVSL